MHIIINNYNNVLKLKNKTAKIEENKIEEVDQRGVVV